MLTRALALLLLALPGTALAAEVFVDAVHGDDVTGDGSAAAPFRTITKGAAALASAPGERLLHVLPGLYDAALGETFPIGLAPGVQLLGAGSRHTLVSGEPAQPVLSIAPGVLVSDLAVRRGTVGILSLADCFGLAEPTRYVRRCEVHHCEIGILLEDCFHSDHGVAVVSSRITENTVGCRVESTDQDFQSVTLLLYGTTVTGNALGVQSVGPGPERYFHFHRSIVEGNAVDTLPTAGILSQTGNVVGDPSLDGQNGTVLADALLAEGADGDVHLRVGSPALDVLAPAFPWPPAPQWVGPGPWVWEPAFELVLDLDGGTRILGGAIDAGADERRAPTVYASAPPHLGAAIDLAVQAGPLEPVVVAVAGALLPAPLPPGIWLAAPIAVVGVAATDAGGIGALPVTLPAGPAWVGVDVHLQAATVLAGLAASDPLTLRLVP